MMTAVVARYSSRRTDLAHHHPEVLRGGVAWTWTCSCGAAGARAATVRATWRQAYIEALRHSAQLTA